MSTPRPLIRAAYAAVAAAAAFLLAACSSSKTSGGNAPAPSAASSAPATGASASASSSPTAAAAPQLRQGQSATVYIESSNTSGPQAIVQVTVDAVKTASSVPEKALGSTDTPSPGTQYLFVQLTLKNIGLAPVDPSDFSGGISTSWVSGNKVSTPNTALGVDASNVGLSSQNLVNLPALQPGQQATGTDVLEVPPGPGTLVIGSFNGDLVKIIVP